MSSKCDAFLLHVVWLVQLLIDAVQRNFQEEHHCQFAGQLLIMTLGFVTRTIKSEVMRDGSSDAKRKISEGQGMSLHVPCILTRLKPLMRVKLNNVVTIVVIAAAVVVLLLLVAVGCCCAVIVLLLCCCCVVVVLLLL